MAMYSTVLLIGTPATAPTDIAMIQGSATKAIKIWNVELDGQATSAANVRANLIRRTTASTGNTITTGSIVPLDIGAPTATAVVTYWNSTAGNPSVLGSVTGGGTLTNTPVFMPAAATAAASPPNPLTPLASENTGLIALHGTVDYLGVNLGGTANPSGACSYVVTITWEEN